MYIAIKNEKIIGIYADNEREGLIDVGIIPSPEEIPGKIPVMYYRNGAIVYEYVDAPEATEDGTERNEIEMMRASTADKVRALFFSASIPSMINTFGLSEKEALSVKDMFPEWKENLGELKAGDKYRYGDNLWEVVKTHTTQENYAPSIHTSSLWKVVEVEHKGTDSDPIPYTPPMEIFEGKYYTENDVRYKCTRDSGIPISQELGALIGIYVVIG